MNELRNYDNWLVAPFERRCREEEAQAEMEEAAEERALERLNRRWRTDYAPRHIGGNTCCDFATPRECAEAFIETCLSAEIATVIREMEAEAEDAAQAEAERAYEAYLDRREMEADDNYYEPS